MKVTGMTIECNDSTTDNLYKQILNKNKIAKATNISELDGVIADSSAVSLVCSGYTVNFIDYEKQILVGTKLVNL